MTRATDDAFQDWTDLAFNANILEVAKQHGAVMKKAGNEFKGPCPTCGGKDRFSCSPARNKWFCRGAQIGGMGSISMVQHIAGLPFKAAVESITGIPCPSGGPARPLSESEQAEHNRQRLKMEEAQRARQEREEQYQEDTIGMSQRVWDASVDLDGTTGALYYNNRGIPKPRDGWPPSLRFHPALPYPGKGKYPAIVARVDDMSGNLTAVWRTYLRADGRKADVPNARLGLGPAGGGAVRLGGLGPKVGLAEGMESSFGAWLLTGQKFPVWSCLSTSGLIGIELPLGVEHVCIFPDGDQPLRKKGDEYEPAVPAGRKAALALRSRLLAEGIGCTIAAEPPPSKDYADLWLNHSRELA